MLAFSNDYYGMIFRATQSVELFCAYFLSSLSFFYPSLWNFLLWIDCCGLPWTFPLWIFLSSAVPFLSGFFLLFPFHRSSSVFLSAAETFLFLLESSRLRQQVLFTALTYSIAAHSEPSGFLSEVKGFHHSRPRRSYNKICLIYLICFHSHPRRS